MIVIAPGRAAPRSGSRRPALRIALQLRGPMVAAKVGMGMGMQMRMLVQFHAHDDEIVCDIVCIATTKMLRVIVMAVVVVVVVVVLVMMTMLCAISCA
jgi:hypothetical protein